MKIVKHHSTQTEPVASAMPLRVLKLSATETDAITTPSKAINAPTIEHNIPMPHGQMESILGKLRETLKAMNVGDSFVWPDNKALYDAAKQTKIKITTRKINGEGYRVWRVE